MRTTCTAPRPGPEHFLPRPRIRGSNLSSRVVNLSRTLPQSANRSHSSSLQLYRSDGRTDWRTMRYFIHRVAVLALTIGLVVLPSSRASAYSQNEQLTRAIFLDLLVSEPTEDELLGLDRHLRGGSDPE